MEAAIEFRGVCKDFGGVRAVDQVDLAVKTGEVHAVVGENGAGKSTLMHILTGLFPPDGGELVVKGKPVRFRGPRQAMEAGICMIHQHFMLVDHFTVLQNVILGREGQSFLISPAKARRQVAELCERYGFRLDLDQEVGELSVGMRQRVEIVKMLYRGGDILILDEPTAVLSPTESGELLQIIGRLREQGKTILLISHKLGEVLSMADRITVLRKGKKIGTVDARAVEKNELTTMMIGRSLDETKESNVVSPGAEILSLDRVCRKVDRRGKALDNLSFVVRAGEIYGVAGLEGNGQSELSAAITGLIQFQSGEIIVNGCPVKDLSPADIRGMGVGVVPEERHRRGLVAQMSVWENFMLGIIRRLEFSRTWGIFPNACLAFAGRMSAAFDIRLASLHQTAGSLSGGNQQKMILARELSGKPALLIASQPARGLDVGSASFVHQKLQDAKEWGAAILLISADLDEVLKLSDRVGIMFNGRIVREFVPGELTLKQIDRYMTGLFEEDASA